MTGSDGLRPFEEESLQSVSSLLQRLGVQCDGPDRGRRRERCLSGPLIPQSRRLAPQGRQSDAMLEQ